MRTPTPSLILNAHCIDFVYGGVYAWAYLATAGIADPDIIAILSTPFNRWAEATPNIADVAHRAMRTVGIQRPVEAYDCTMP
ncbi:hypothetical protein [Duganella sp. Root1480D1]|uniref:hypothetical protein n=1 Tax=Duganella sp. Root1480D1 TaxID=1736471 RepID=UPI00070C69A2|nr:hypothetical protein [Duganella sp. Root1480D1]KQZ30270.1 hypothetical protein ASD58_09585 [Duganella sp. Root1480D1]